MPRHIFKMTPKAIQSTWTSTTGGNHIPTKWLIDGDKKDGYTISAVDDELCGFDFVALKTLYAAKLFVEQVNETGHTDYEKFCSVGSFSHRNIPVPT